MTMTTKSSAIAPMRRNDIAEVAAIFYRALRRPDRQPSDEFRDYFEQSFFGGPSYDPAQAGTVHRDATGRIDGALVVVPMQVSVSGRIVTGRLVSHCITDPMHRGGAHMVQTIRSRDQDFCFSDSADAISAEHWKAAGGKVLPIHSLDWHVVLRPAGWLVRRGRSRLQFGMYRLAAAVARSIDAGLRELVPGRQPIGYVEPMTRAAFITEAPGLVERFAVHPVWAPEELGWLLDMAGLNAVDGPLQLLAIRNDAGALLGCCAVYAQPGGVAKVLNILAHRRHEATVVEQVLAFLEESGCVAARGMAQPFLMEALGRRKDMSFVPRGAYCISTKHPEIVDALLKGDCYLGGLMGEDWSRLVTDFHD